MRVPMPSPYGTNREGKFVESYFLTPPRLALDAAPMYETSGTAGVKNGGTGEKMGPMGADLHRKIMDALGPGVLSEDEAESLRGLLGAGEEEGEDEQFNSGQLDPTKVPPPVAEDEFEPMRAALREKGFDEESISKIMPRATSARPATEGGLGGRATGRIGAMDSVLSAARNRLAWKRGDGLSISPRAEPRLPDEPNRLTAEQNRQLDDYLGIGRIKQA